MSFGVGSLWEDDREIPKNMKFVFSKCHITGSLEDIQKEYNIQPQLLQGEIAHDLITLSNYKEFESLWKPSLIDGVLGLAYVVSKHGNSIRKTRGEPYENSLQESSLSWACLGDI